VSFLSPEVITAAELNHRAGFAMRDVTPSVASLKANDTYMGGYGFWTDRGPAESVHDPLEANAMCLTAPRSSEGMCLAIVDSLGLTGPIIKAIKADVVQRIPLTADQIFIGATHTHAAPDLLGLWGGSPPEYVASLINSTADSVVSAFENMRPATLYYSLGEGKAHNRRDWGFTDTTIVVIDAIGDNGLSLGTFVNFASHPVVSTMDNKSLSSDYVHYLREKVAEKTGATVVFVNGAIGDVNPRALREPDMWMSARTYGEAIAEAAISSMKSREPASPGVKVTRIPFTTSVENTILALAQFLGIIEEDNSGPPWNLKVATQLGRIKLGNEVEFVSVPGEALTRTGLSIKDNMDMPAEIILGLTGGSLGYFVPKDEWESGRNDNYEESVSLGSHLAGQIVQLLEE